MYFSLINPLVSSKATVFVSLDHMLIFIVYDNKIIMISSDRLDNRQ